MPLWCIFILYNMDNSNIEQTNEQTCCCGAFTNTDLLCSCVTAHTCSHPYYKNCVWEPLNNAECMPSIHFIKQLQCTIQALTTRTLSLESQVEQLTKTINGDDDTQGLSDKIDNIVTDDEVNATSENPVQNKAIYLHASAIDDRLTSQIGVINAALLSLDTSYGSSLEIEETALHLKDKLGNTLSTIQIPVPVIPTIQVDETLNSVSVNPVQNKAVTNAFNTMDETLNSVSATSVQNRQAIQALQTAIDDIPSIEPDSFVKREDIQSTITAGSNKLVTSGAIYTAVNQATSSVEQLQSTIANMVSTMSSINSTTSAHDRSITRLLDVVGDGYENVDQYWNRMQDPSTAAQYPAVLTKLDDLYSAVGSKQSMLIQGVNLKTVNGQSILMNSASDPTDITVSAQITIDDHLDVNSTNPVQNKVINGAISGIQTTLAGKQNTLVSGTNIKTINGSSLLGSGDITISSGGTISVDSQLNGQSTNPVQNSTISSAIADINTDIAGIESSLTTLENTVDSIDRRTPESRFENLVSRSEVQSEVQSGSNNLVTSSGINSAIQSINVSIQDGTYGSGAETWKNLSVSTGNHSPFLRVRDQIKDTYGVQDTMPTVPTVAAVQTSLSGLVTILSSFSAATSASQYANRFIISTGGDIRGMYYSDGTDWYRCTDGTILTSDIQNQSTTNTTE